MGMIVEQRYKKDILWINCTKFIAVFMVLFNHTSDIVYSSEILRRFSVGSVGLFLLLSGYTSYGSWERNGMGNSDKSFFWKRIKEILEAWVIVSIIYYVVLNHAFDFEAVLNGLVHFNISRVFYYVFMYIQLMLVSCGLLPLIKRNGLFKDGVLFAAIAVLSCIFTNYTNILDIFGAGGRLFGGTNLIFFLTGMLLKKYRIMDNVKNSPILLLFGIPWGVLFYYRVQFGNSVLNKHSFIPIITEGNNPPSLTIIISSVLLFLFCAGFFQIMEKAGKIALIMREGIGWIGKHTLYIYLYYMLILYLHSRDSTLGYH